jgi:hypothetical protein
MHAVAHAAVGTALTFGGIIRIHILDIMQNIGLKVQ